MHELLLILQIGLTSISVDVDFVHIYQFDSNSINLTDLEVMRSNPDWVEHGVRSTSVPSCT